MKGKKFNYNAEQEGGLIKERKRDESESRVGQLFDDRSLQD